MNEESDQLCPHCGSDQVAEIVYGLPSADMVDEGAHERVVLGGCSVTPDDPTHACQACGSEWAASTDPRSTMMRQGFADYFAHWSIELPPGAEAASAHGTIHKAGWTIRYRFDVEDGESYLEFYASHRMTNDRHVKITTSGEVEHLDAIDGMIIYDPKEAGSEEKAREKNRIHNDAVVADLEHKQLYPTGDVNAFLRTGGGEAMDALEEMEELLREAKLPIPPIPNALRYKMRKTAPWCFATVDVDPINMYLFREQLIELLLQPPEHAVAFCHAGHGINSYAINYQLVYRNLVLLVQSPWGGVYTDREKAIQRLSEMFQRCGELVALVEEHNVTRPLLVADSSMRGIRICGWIPVLATDGDAKTWIKKLIDDTSDKNRAPYSEARRLLLRRGERAQD